MQFKVLGPLKVIGDDGEHLQISRGRQRGLLAVMLLRANEPLSPGRLADAQYDGAAGRSGSALRTDIWQLRRGYPPLAHRLRTVSGGYLIEVRPGESDVDQFHALADQGQRALHDAEYRPAADLLGEACSVWRDPAIADIPATLAMVHARDRLLDERQVACEYLATARMALGHHRELLGELRERVLRWPLAEAGWEQLMLALYRCGRRSEALGTFTQARKILVTEYGIDLGARLRCLQKQILVGDPVLDLPAAIIGP